MGERTIELTITNPWDDSENTRAIRLFDAMPPAQFLTDADMNNAPDRFMFDAHDEAGNEYVVVIRDEPSEEVWANLWEKGYVKIVIDRGLAMRAIPSRVVEG